MTGRHHRKGDGIAAVRRFFAAGGRATAADLKALMGLTREAAFYALRRLRAEGAVVPVGLRPAARVRGGWLGQYDVEWAAPGPGVVRITIPPRRPAATAPVPEPQGLLRAALAQRSPLEQAWSTPR